MKDQMTHLRNGLPIPPVPHRLREILKDYPEHIQGLQEELNNALDGSHPARGTANHVFEEIIWSLEGCLDAYIRTAKDELEASETTQNTVAIAKAKEKLSLLRQARSGSNGMLVLTELRAYVDRYQEAFK